MYIVLPGFAYKQYVHESRNGEGEKVQETREAVYDVTFEIELDQIEAITPSAGPLSHPQELPYSRIIGKSGRYYDIALSFKDLQKKIHRAMQENYHKQLIVNRN